MVSWTEKNWKYRALRVVEYERLGSGDLGVVLRSETKTAQGFPLVYFHALWTTGEDDRIYMDNTLEEHTPEHPRRVVTKSRRAADIRSVMARCDISPC